MEPPVQLMAYATWMLTAPFGRRPSPPSIWSEVTVHAVKEHGTGFIARLCESNGRDDAAGLTGQLIGLPREQMPVLENDEFYWADLIGSLVVDREGQELGLVRELFETGANDVMVVVGERERLVPFVPKKTVIEVDLERQKIVVDWDRSF